jgi:hypothetical protein
MNDDDSHRWRWISFIDRLTGGDITKTDEVYKRNYIETLNLLSFWKKRDDAERLAQRMNKNIV